MLWQIKPFSHRCCISDEPFETGDGYVSYLMIDGNNELQRFDVSLANDEQFEPEGQILCHWRQVYKREPVAESAASRQRETAEGLFLSLYEEEEEPADDDSGDEPGAGEDAIGEGEVMKKFLSLLLERKRILRPRGHSPDGQFRLMEHARSKNIYPVPAGELSQEELMRISGRLNALVGG